MVLRDADISKNVKALSDDVEHLEFIGAVGSELIGAKIAMALLRDEGKDPKEYVSMDENLSTIILRKGNEHYAIL